MNDAAAPEGLNGRAGPVRREPSVVLIAAPDPQVGSLMREAVRTSFPSVVLQLASDGQQAERLIGATPPDWVLVDLNLLEDLRNVFVPDPSREARSASIAIAGHGQDDRILPALRLGAIGYVIKRDPQDVIARQLRALASGTTPLTQALAGHILRELDWSGMGASLTKAELELLTWIFAGDTPAEAASRIQVDSEVLAELLASIWSKTVFPCPPLPAARTG